jgi:LmbE family N-acetylglucosaminyl deacetylase
MEKLLIFAPHPDDDIIACAGTIAKNVQQGHPVSIVYISSGEAGSLSYGPEELTLIRETEARQAANLLGVTDQLFLHNPDGYITFVQEIMEALVSIIRAQQPTMVFLPHEGEDVHDHRQSYQLVMEACKRAAGPWFPACGQPWSVDTILAYEVWTPLSQYNLAVDISDFMQVKLAALREHKSQLSTIAYDEAVQGLNRYRGITSGVGQYAECFAIIKAKL